MSEEKTESKAQSYVQNSVEIESRTSWKQSPLQLEGPKKDFSFHVIEINYWIFTHLLVQWKSWKWCRLQKTLNYCLILDQTVTRKKGQHKTDIYTSKKINIKQTKKKRIVIISVERHFIEPLVWGNEAVNAHEEYFGTYDNASDKAIEDQQFLRIRYKV